MWLRFSLGSSYEIKLNFETAVKVVYKHMQGLFNAPDTQTSDVYVLVLF